MGPLHSRGGEPGHDFEQHTAYIASMWHSQVACRLAIRRWLGFSPPLRVVDYDRICGRRASSLTIILIKNASISACMYVACLSGLAPLQQQHRRMSVKSSRSCYRVSYHMTSASPPSCRVLSCRSVRLERPPWKHISTSYRSSIPTWGQIIDSHVVIYIFQGRNIPDFV